MFLFLLGEGYGYVISGSCISRWRLPFFACAFGLLNAATLASIHLVSNAVTGHWITVGLRVADDLPVVSIGNRVGLVAKQSRTHPNEFNLSKRKVRSDGNRACQWERRLLDP